MALLNDLREHPTYRRLPALVRGQGGYGTVTGASQRTPAATRSGARPPIPDPVALLEPIDGHGQAD